jgi:pimeloyl-ACP methyl ester carboxylesterase
MNSDWELVESGSAGASKTVLLLPGGMCSARSYADVMAQDAPAGTRLVAVTFPGQAGTTPPDDVSVEHFARITAELAKRENADVVVGFSMGAVVAAEMVIAGAFTGPVVLLGVSLSSPDEPAFFRAIIRLGTVLGTLPAAILKRGAMSMAQHARLPDERRAALRADFALNNPADLRRSLRAYLRWLKRGAGRVEQLCNAGVPIWVVHAEKGDGGLTGHERRVLDACPHANVVTLPGSVFFIPNEAPAAVAALITDALTHRSSPHNAARTTDA